MQKSERDRLKELSRLAFGRTSRWRTIMKKGRLENGVVKPISVKEIEDTMLFILAEREKIQNESNEIRSRETENWSTTIESTSVSE